MCDILLAFRGEKKNVFSFEIFSSLHDLCFLPVTFSSLSVLNSVFHVDGLLACLVTLDYLPLFKNEELISLLEALRMCEGLANFERHCGIICLCHLLGNPKVKP